MVGILWKFCVCFITYKIEVLEIIFYFSLIFISYWPANQFRILFTKVNKMFFAIVLHYFFMVGYHACLQRFYLDLKTRGPMVL